jgi:YggT family protein
MSLVHEVIFLYILVLFATALISWFPASSNSGGLASTRRVLAALTEPILRPVRQILPQPRVGGVNVDFSVMVVIFLLIFINSFI